MRNFSTLLRENADYAYYKKPGDVFICGPSATLLSWPLEVAPHCT